MKECEREGESRIIGAADGAMDHAGLVHARDLPRMNSVLRMVELQIGGEDGKFAFR